MKKIIHISDLHFGTEVPRIVEKLLKDIQEINADLLVVSGDLTQRARVEQFRKFLSFSNKIDIPKIIVPGNHDIPLYNIYKRFVSPLKNFKQIITTEDFPIYKSEDMIVIGVSSARSFTIKDGRISLEQIEKLKEILCEIPKDCFKGIVIHHNLIPSPENKNETLLGRANLFLNELRNCGINMMFSGHLHEGYLGNIQKYYHSANSIIISQAGTATSTRTRNENNSFNVIQIFPEEIHIKIKRFNGNNFISEKVNIFSR